MTTAGWILMTGSLVFVWWLTLWCFYRVLKASPDHPVEPPPTL